MTVREEAREQARVEYSHAKISDRYDADLLMAGFEDGAMWQAGRGELARHGCSYCGRPEAVAEGLDPDGDYICGNCALPKEGTC